ncbi:EAL domain-containing protein [Natronospirillum operosum]|uniref:cyclic-guanylate-specific phosphodiesterase n=1 Tax=Natronospirillum operosum TaxID=2759953 RepID=A0A4Z0W6K7_9GAMM|nr:EAL domain-containing protein [Natronospirillum operosum]TGG93434.1 EAL domain-containing protein [Natronospirillum operosum]
MSISLPSRLLARVILRWVAVTSVVMGLVLLVLSTLWADVGWALQLIPLSGALGATVIGLALVGVWLHRPWLRLSSGLALILIGALSLLSWAAADWLLGIWPALAALEPVRTGSLRQYWLAAVLFLTFGLTFLVSPQRRRLWLGVGIAWLLTGIALMLVHVFSPVAHWWASNASGASLISLFIVFGGSALIASAGQEDGVETKGLRRATWWVGLGGFMLGCMIWYALSAQHQRDLTAGAATVGHNMETAINQLLRSHYVSMSRMVASWSGRGLLDEPWGETAPASVQADADQFLTDLRSFAGLGFWLPAQSRSEMLVYRHGDDAQWAEWLQQPALGHCRTGQQWRCNLAFVPAKEQKPGLLLMAVPMHDSRGPIGMLLGMVDFDTLMTNHLHLEAYPYVLTVQQGTEEIYQHRPAQLSASEESRAGELLYYREAALFDQQVFSITVHHGDSMEAARLPNLILLATLVSLLLSTVIALTLELAATNASRSRALSRSIMRQRQLRRIEDMVAREQPLADIGRAAADHLVRQLEASQCLVVMKPSLVNSDPFEMAVATLDGVDPEVLLPDPDLYHTPLRQALHTAQPLLVPDLEDESRWPEFNRRALRAGYRAALVFPVLTTGREVLGVLALFRIQPGVLTGEEQGDIDDVSPLIGLAVEQERSKSALVYASRYDVLTELPNRGYLQQRLIQWVQQATERAEGLAVLFIDLDGFKPVNDSLGHTMGDQVLRQVGQRLQQVFPSDTFVSRLGGDEFVALVPEYAGAGTAGTDHLIVQALEILARPFVLADLQVSLTASVGATRLYPGQTPPDDPLLLLQQADLAMYKAKRGGRNHFEWYLEGDQSRQHRKVQLRHDLQQALIDGEFRLHYQPIISHTDAVIAVEALLRWQHPEQGMISPSEFIPLAEETGQIIPLSNWVLDQVCRDARVLRQQWPLQVAVNLSPLQFLRPQFRQQLMEVVAHYELPPQALNLELTEHTLVEDPEQAATTLRELQSAGFGISIDDFGTGFSSLSYLKWLPVSALKIDRSFIRDMQNSPRELALVRAIIDMAHELDLTVVAEGVERREQAQALQSLGCDCQQGYYYARPKDFTALLVWLQSRGHWRTGSMG